MGKAWILILLGGCANQLALGRSALRHENRGDVYAAEGNGDMAEREYYEADQRRVAAQLRAERHATWVWSELMLR